MNGATFKNFITNTGWVKDKHFPGLPLRDGVYWSSGLDISLGTDMTNSDPQNQLHATKLMQRADVNEVVCDDLVYSIGMPISMTVFSQAGPDAAEELTGLDNGLNVIAEKIHAVLGKANECIIFTGQIAFVGEKHIECIT